jgi:hypothetical protein
VRKKLLTVPLDELQTARITCMRGGCGGIIELPADKLYKVASSRCPVCDHEFYLGQGNPNPLSRLKAVLEEMGQLTAFVSVQFVIPDEPPETK